MMGKILKTQNTQSKESTVSHHIPQFREHNPWAPHHVQALGGGRRLLRGRGEAAGLSCIKNVPWLKGQVGNVWTMAINQTWVHR